MGQVQLGMMAELEALTRCPDLFTIKPEGRQTGGAPNWSLGRSTQKGDSYGSQKYDVLGKGDGTEFQADKQVAGQRIN